MRNYRKKLRLKLNFLKKRKRRNQIKNKFKRRNEELKKLVGRCGVCLTDLRYCGYVRIRYRTYEASSKFHLIKKGSFIRVQGVHMWRLIVEEISKEENTNNSF